jgi:hypothetical protein
MAETKAVDILIVGTGDFAARQLFDIAATAERPVVVGVAGRNTDRLAWLKTAAQARASIYAKPVTVVTRTLGLERVDDIAETIAMLSPKVVVQTASLQGSSVIGTSDDGWARLIAAAGYGLTTVFQTLLSSRVAQATARAGIDAAFINCCYPDVVNRLLAAKQLPVLCGVGNIGILSSAFAGAALGGDERRLKLIAHYSVIGTWRLPRQDRLGPIPRVWIDDAEIDNVIDRFAEVQLTAKPVIDISGATGVPLMLAIAGGYKWFGHVPGPEGRIGGYPVTVDGRALRLRLPPGLSESDAVAWNENFEARDGIQIDARGHVSYAGRLAQSLTIASPSLAEGFHVEDLEDVYSEMATLSAHLSGQP